MTTLLDALGTARHGVAVSPTIEALLSGLTVVTENPVGPDDLYTGTAQGTITTSLLDLCTVDLAPFGPHIQYRWKALPAGGFRLDLLLPGTDAATQAVSFVDPDTVLHAAAVQSEPDPQGGPDRQWLTKTGAALDLHADLCLRVDGTPTTPATITWLKFTAGDDPADDVFVLQPAPTAILFGDSGFGIDIPAGIVVDDSAAYSAPGSPAPAWTGLAITGAKLYIPRDIPLIGGHAIAIDLLLGVPGGLNASAQTTIPAAGQRPAIDVRLEWQDPAAATLADLLPTAIEATAVFTVAGSHHTTKDGKAFTLAGGDPLTVRVRCSRAITPAASMSFEVSVDAAGPDGLIKATGTDPAGTIVVTAAAMATALIADSALSTPSPSGDRSGVWLPELLTAAEAASVCVDPAGTVVVDRASLALSTAGAGQAMRLSIDYLVDVKVHTVDLGGVMHLGMADDHPMRIRYRNVAVETTGPDLGSMHLSFAAATMDVVDPGLWNIHTPGSLLDVVGTRSGHGSLWYEIDLAFRVDLGPVTVSNATVRVTPDGAGGLSAELRGLGVDVTTPALTGQGAAQITNDGFSADLSATILPLRVGARASFDYKGEDSILVSVDGALPGPIPLGPTGLGLYSLGGLFGLNVHPVLPDIGTDDIVDRQLAWEHGNVEEDPGAIMLGLDAGVGTVYDLAFTFSATGNLLVTVPDLAFRLAVNARMLQPADFPNTKGSPLKGLIVVDGNGITVGARGDLHIDSDPPQLVSVTIPLDAWLPFKDPSSWYFRLGSDGVNGRTPGPMTARVLPDLFDIDASAYLMVQGDNLNNLGGAGFPLPGPAIGVGFAVDTRWGVPPVWLALSARAAVGMATNPWFLAGRGTIGGALHLGPFSIGAHADLDVRVGPGAFLWAKFRVCGSIDLWLTEIEGCVDIHIGPDDPATTAVPVPPPWRPLKMSLSDRHYVEVAEGADNAGDAPTVWPDVVPILQFDLGPDLTKLTTPFSGAENLQCSGRTGNDKLSYTHFLTAVELWRVDGPAPVQLTAGLEAAWQVPKHAEINGGSSLDAVGARELALLTYVSDLWAHRRSDGAADAPPGCDPVTATATACRVDHEASPGWALGDGARSASGGWTLPSESESGTHPSRFTAAVTVGPWSREIALSEAAMADVFPAQFPYRPAGVVPVDPNGIEQHTFSAGLALPLTTSALGWDDTSAEFGTVYDIPTVTVTVIADDTVRAAVLWMLVDCAFPNLHDAIRVTDVDSGAPWIVAGLADAPGNRMRVGYTAPADTRGARLNYPVLQGMIILGLHGVSIRAVDAATAAGNAAAAAAATITDHNNDPAPIRTPLKLEAGGLYKVVVTTRTDGRLDQGATAEFDHGPLEYFFRTATLPDPGAAMPWHRFAWDQTVFETGYLARYLKSYTPGDRTENWYLGDDLVANFDQDHVEQLAKLYGYALTLACQRTDGPPSRPDDPSPWIVTLHPRWDDLADTSILDLLGRRYLALDPDRSCPVPKSGASLKAGADNLQPLATYQLNVAFQPVHTPGEEDSPPAKPLPGIVFRTSRYHGPKNQIAALGFGAPPGHPHGQLLVTPAALPAPETSDTAWAAALTAFGLDGWPLPGTGRTSLLWTSDTRQLAGVLVESPEPLVRPGRLDVTGLQVNGVAFDSVYGDSSRCRHLFAPPAPVDVGAAQAVTLTLGYTDAGMPRVATCTATSPAAGEVIL